MDRSRRLVAIRDALNALIDLDAVTRAIVVTLIARSSPLPADGNGLDYDPPPQPKVAPAKAKPAAPKPKGKPTTAEVAKAGERADRGHSRPS